jgi:DNA helicase-2/ATP-dependent DNA helicase PcrA
MKQLAMAFGTAAEGVPALNAEQRRAVEHGDGPLLVVAGAGTGKTRVIIERIRNLLETNPTLAGEHILGLTFTDKAAGEMKSRVVKAIGERAEGVWLSTFHKFCQEKILQAVNPDLQVLEPIDQWILLRRNIAELQLVKFWKLTDPGEFLNAFVAFFSRCHDELVTPDDFQRYVEGLRRGFESRPLAGEAGKASLEADAREIEEEEIERQEELARAFRVSERLVRERNFVTFGEQLMNAVHLLRTDTGLLERMREQYRYILVDEFQDTNIAQLELLWLLAGERGNIVAVGDDDQAIYRFRGASFGSFTIFLKRFCGVKDSRLGAEAKRFLVSLSQNYRSTRRILRVAGQAISHNEKSQLLPPKKLTTEQPDGERIRIAEFATPEEEAQWIAMEIERLHAAGSEWRKFAVLYRKHTHRERLLVALRGKRIPFVIKNLSILTSTIVRDLLAYIRAIATPSDNVATARVLAVPYWGLEPRDLVRLAERAEKNRRRPLSDEMDAAQQDLPFAGNATRLRELVLLLNRMRQTAKKKTASEVLDELIASLELAPLPSDADYHYLVRFVEFVKGWQAKNEEKSLRSFAEYLRYFDEAGGDICLEEGPADDAVQLMTVHAAKGLEFRHVFVLQLSKGDFPARPQAPMFEFPPELMKEEKPKGDFQSEEERRLFYVALTRARRNLTLSTVVNKRRKPSMFLDDILMNGDIQRSDVTQLTPKVELPVSEETVGPEPNSADPGGLFGSANATARAYSRVALWAKAYHPPLAEPLQLSASAIEQYQKCPMTYLFRYVWRIQGGAHANMTFGKVMHSTVQEFVAELRKGRKASFDEVASIYDRQWSSAGYRDDFLEGEYRKEGRAQLERFHRSYSARPCDVLYQEKAFELPLEHNIVVTGRMDQVNRIGPGEVEIVDYKTGKHKDEKKTNESLQLSVYALATREVLELDPVRLVFYNLTTNEAVSTTRDEKALAKTRQTIAEVGDQIRAGDFGAKPGFLCRHCDFKPICPAHEQLISIQPKSANKTSTK